MVADNIFSFINNKLSYFYFLGFSDWIIIAFGSQFFKVFIYEPNFDICNEWDKKQRLYCNHFSQSYAH